MRLLAVLHTQYKLSYGGGEGIRTKIRTPTRAGCLGSEVHQHYDAGRDLKILEL